MTYKFIGKSRYLYHAEITIRVMILCLSPNQCYTFLLL
uniref:Uncharacterized protein n=1 Tax=Lepeophtheirus salmonis TaxID=72036 RepID=A0A0K2UH09_LEPSM